MARNTIEKTAAKKKVAKKRGRPPGVKNKAKAVVPVKQDAPQQLEFDFAPQARVPEELMVMVPARLLRDLLNAVV